jgi:hypothetical protein
MVNNLIIILTYLKLICIDYLLYLLVVYMKMRRILQISLLLFCSVQLAVSQQDSFDIDAIEIPDSTVFKKSINKEPKKLKLGVDVGMSYMFSSNGVHGPAYSLAPHAVYPLGNKFAVSAGLFMEYGNFYIPSFTGERNDSEMLPMTRMFVYASGHYFMSEKLTVTGSVYQQVMDVPNRNKSINPQAFNYRGMSAGFNYKLTPNITIGARISVETPNNNPWNNGFYPSGNYSPFGL